MHLQAADCVRPSCLRRWQSRQGKRRGCRPDRCDVLATTDHPVCLGAQRPVCHRSRTPAPASQSWLPAHGRGESSAGYQGRLRSTALLAGCRTACRAAQGLLTCGCVHTGPCRLQLPASLLAWLLIPGGVCGSRRPKCAEHLDDPAHRPAVGELACQTAKLPAQALTRQPAVCSACASPAAQGCYGWPVLWPALQHKAQQPLHLGEPCQLLQRVLLQDVLHATAPGLSQGPGRRRGAAWGCSPAMQAGLLAAGERRCVAACCSARAAGMCQQARPAVAPPQRLTIPGLVRRTKRHAVSSASYRGSPVTSSYRIVPRLQTSAAVPGRLPAILVSMRSTSGAW